MDRLFGKSKAPAPRPTLNDTAATLDLRVDTLNKQISTIDQGWIERLIFFRCRMFVLFRITSL